MPEEFHSIELSTDSNIKMLEQLNKTLELLQDNCLSSPERDDLRQFVEKRVLECIAMICTPFVEFSELSSGHTNS